MGFQEDMVSIDAEECEVVSHRGYVRDASSGDDDGVEWAVVSVDSCGTQES